MKTISLSFWRGAFFCLTLSFVLGQLSSVHAAKIEEAQRALQDRYYAVKGTYIAWPNDTVTGTPGNYPTNGHYSASLANVNTAANLVGHMIANAAEIPNPEKYYIEESDLEGQKSITTIPFPQLGGTTTANYVENFSAIVKYICSLKQFVMPARQVGSSGAGDSYPEGRRGSESGDWRDHYFDGELVDFSALNGAINEWKYYSGWGADGWYDSEGIGMYISLYGSIEFYLGEGGDWENDSYWHARIETMRGKIYADLTNVPYKGHVFLVANSQFEGVVSTPPATPVAADGTFHHYATAEAGQVYTSPVIGNVADLPTIIPLGPLDFTTIPPPDDEGDYVRGYGALGQWSLGQIVLFTPDFTNNIEKCEGECLACQRCELGACEISPNGVKLNVGNGSHGASAGSLTIPTLVPGSRLSTPSGLVVLTGGGTSKAITDSNGTLKQFKAPQGAANIAVINDYKYEMRFYPANQVTSTPDASGAYPVTGSPSVTWIFENPNASTSDVNTFRVTEQKGSTSTVNEYKFTTGATSGVELSTGNGLRKESRLSSIDPVTKDRIEVVIIKGSDNVVVSHEVNTYHRFAWGEEKIKQVVDPNGETALTSQWTYYETSPGYRQVKVMIQPSGYWEQYEYDLANRLTKVISPFKDSALNSVSNSVPPAEENLHRVVTTSYGSTAPAVTVIEKLLGQEISRRYTVDFPGERRDIQCKSIGALWNDPSNLVTITKTSLGGASEGEVQSILRPDGTMSIYTYAKTATQKTTTVKTGEPNAAKTDIIDGTKTVSVVDQFGGSISEKTYDVASPTLLLASQITTQKDAFGRPTRVDFLDGTYSTTVYGCCGIESSRDREGITTSYIYDAAKRLVLSTRAGISTMYSYDAEGRVVKTIRKGSDGTEIIASVSEYDLSGRLKSSKDASNHTTTFNESLDTATGRLVKTTTFTDGSTRIETYFKDGSLLSVGGTAAHPIKQDTGVEADGVFTKEIRPKGGFEVEWVKSYSDALGRTYKTVFPDGASSQSTFNNQGQLTSQVNPGITNLFKYNLKGEQQDVAIDMDGSGSIEEAGTDRISRSQRKVLAARGTTVQKTSQSIFITGGLNTVYTNATFEVSVDGLKSWSTIHGLTTATTNTYNGTGGKTTVVVQPDGTAATSIFQNGRMISSTLQKTGVGILNSATFTYDSHGRQKTITDALGKVTSFTYNELDQTQSIAVTGPGGLSQTTSFEYDSMGRRSKSILPDGGIVHYEYYPTGELKKTYGTRTYPTEYTYDSQGRLQKLIASSGTTTWNYDPWRGWLNSKVYASGGGLTYTHTPGGQLKTKRSSRGITTTYSYNQAGDLSSIDYSDTTQVPDVSYTLDRRGRSTQVDLVRDSGVETCSYSFNKADQILSESHTGGTLVPMAGITVSSGYDTLLRRSAISSTLNGVQLTTNSFIYDAASRLSKVTAGTYSATYGYRPSSFQVQTVTLKQGSATRLTTTKTYDGLDRLSQISSAPSADTAGSWSYQYNQANQRTQVNLADGSYWIYGYNGQGEVVFGGKYSVDGTALPGQQFGYEFDNIGNRTGQWWEGETGYRGANYTPNNLNQYTERTIPGSFDFIGTAKSDAKVTLQLGTSPSGIQETTRFGDIFYKELNLDNSAGPVSEQVKVVGVKNNVGTGGEDVVTEKSGRIFVPKTPEVFTYDADGNLTSDGRWNYTKWDAENRLISMESVAGIPAEAKRKLDFTYDYQGRRIQKIVSTWNGTAYAASSTTKFIYDGWNCIAELNGSSALQKSFVWGLDLSGSMQGAGGVGGLLMVTSGTGVHFSAMDGNGNVSALVNAADGKISAEYEYSPFGELIRSTGAMANVNPFRFSTKWQDNESGFLYYGYRYYNPSTGRWLNRDLIEERGGMNLYGFALNSAVNFYDRNGLDVGDYGTDSSNTRPRRTVDTSTAKPTTVLNAFFYGKDEKLWVFGPTDPWTRKVKGWAPVLASISRVKRSIRENPEDWEKNHKSDKGWRPTMGAPPAVRPPHTENKNYSQSNPAGTTPLNSALDELAFRLSGGYFGENLWFSTIGSFSFYVTVDEIDCPKKNAKIRYWMYNAMTIDSYGIFASPDGEYPSQYMWWTWGEDYSFDDKTPSLQSGQAVPVWF
jgi:RHS repeat-associated protein